MLLYNYIANARWKSSHMLWETRGASIGNVYCAYEDLFICIEMCIKHLIEFSGRVSMVNHDITNLLNELPLSYKKATWYDDLYKYSEEITQWYEKSLRNKIYDDLSFEYETLSAVVEQLHRDAMHNVTY